jgi:hypothetical protein
VELKDLVQICTSLVNSTVFVGTLVWGIDQYRRQRRNNFEEGKQANRSRLTEAYMAWHAAVLSTRENVGISASLIRRAHHVLGHGRGHVTSEQTHAVHILYMMLNALYLEWEYRKSYSLPLEEFDRTVDHAIVGIINNPNPEFEDIVNNFERVFDDFSPDFRSRIATRIKELRELSAKL